MSPQPISMTPPSCQCQCAAAVPNVASSLRSLTGTWNRPGARHPPLAHPVSCPDPDAISPAPRTLLLELAKIRSGDVVLPVRRPLEKASGDRAHPPDRVIRLRCVTAPNEAQKVLLHRLGLTLPQRLRQVEEIVQM